MCSSDLFATSYELGQYALWGAGLATLLAFGSSVVSRIGGVGVLAIVAIIGLWPVALTGHAAGTLDHDAAVNLQMFHLVGLAVWMGGLVSLVVVRRWLADDLAATVRRYSTLAAWSFALVAVSGVWGAWLRLPSPGAVMSPYGALLGLKAVAIVCLAIAGW